MERKRALLLSGPQHYDPERPKIHNIRKVFEHADPLGIAIVSSALKQKGVETRWSEMPVDNFGSLMRVMENFDAVFISARNYDTDMAEDAVSAAHINGKPSIVGGYSPTFNNNVYENATSVVKGEVEPVIGEIVDDLLSGRLRPLYDSRQLPPHNIQDDYIRPDRTIFPEWKGPKRHIKKHTQEWQRGCSNFCTFCSPVRMQRPDAAQSGRVPRVRDVGDVLDEIDNDMKLQPGDHLFSVDLNSSSIPVEQQYELYSELKKRGIRWYTEGTVSQLIANEKMYGDKSLLSVMSARDSLGGCYSFLYGADDLDSIKVAGSSDKTLDNLRDSVSTFRQYGIPLNLSVVVGLDSHTFPESFYRVAEVIEEVRAPYAFIHVATPYEGTVWGKQVIREGRVNGNHGSIDYNHRKVVHDPKNMTADQLQQGYYWLLNHLNTPRQLASTARANFDRSTAINNPTLAVIQSGLVWGVETQLSSLELRQRGRLDSDIQKELSAGYKHWKKS